MNRTHYRHWSPALGRDMELLAFGQGGARVLAFPTSCGRFWDWEDRGLVRSLSGPIERGEIQLFCLDSVDAESWYDYHKHPGDRVRRHDQYDCYVFQEVLPFTEQLNGSPFAIVTGASFGGYHAVNFGLRHPERIGRVLSMSGLCDIRRLIGDWYDDPVYFHNPVDFIANEHDPDRLSALRRLDIILAVGESDSLCASNQLLSQRLWEKGIGNALRIWHGFAHDWPFWEQMLARYLPGHD
jgi:esterase/lipase superfamily enzyme